MTPPLEAISRESVLPIPLSSFLISMARVRDRKIGDVLGNLTAIGSIDFELLGVTRVPNATWFRNAIPCVPAVATVKNPLRRRRVASTLNIYTANFPYVSFVFYTTVPWDYSPSPKDNGVVLSSTFDWLLKGLKEVERSVSLVPLGMGSPP